jgi:hypothetical protein
VGQHPHAPPAGVILSHILHLQHLRSKKSTMNEGCGVCGGIGRGVQRRARGLGGLQAARVGLAGAAYVERGGHTRQRSILEFFQAAAATGAAQLSLQALAPPTFAVMPGGQAG